MIIPDVEKPVSPEAEGLVDLEIETDGSHKNSKISLQTPGISGKHDYPSFPISYHVLPARHIS